MGYYEETEPYRTLLKICDDLGFRYTTHDSHGFYISVQSPKRLMIDPSPDNVYLGGMNIAKYPKGMCLVRDRTHDYRNPTYLAKFDLNATGGFEALRLFLQNEAQEATPINVIREVFPDRMTIDLIAIGRRYRLKRKLYFKRHREETSITLEKGLELVAEKKNVGRISDDTVTLSFADGKVKIDVIPADLEEVVD